MTDYGHDLQFGSFITPGQQAPQAVVDLAITAERAGLDLVTFQDHPYQPSFLDTWTLLSYVAARTERITLAPNVLNVPLRPPAVVARSAASLDLLSGGRFELGLGSGAFWDAIEAMGAPRLTPGQAVDALSEAIDVIRGMWDTENPEFFRVTGEHYRIEGAKRGPAPAHPIEIWLGAYKPRMLRLVGTKADGWLPSASYLDSLALLAEGNARIDDAAAEAGREPTQIRRLLNIGRNLASPDELADLALTYGVSTFILGTDDARELQRFGQEIAPATREIVSAERASGNSERPRSPGRGGAGRRASRANPEAALSPLLDYDAIPPELADTIITPRDAGYDDVRSTYLAVGRPGVVIMARNSDDVSAAVRFAASQDAPFSVRSGGHGIAGLSTNDDGILLDLSKLNELTILDEASRRFRIGSGATWGHVARQIGEHGWAVTSGNFGDVGVGGLATAGGIGWLARKFGMTVDHVRAADIVLADGSLVHVDETHHPDLFWAVRGGGLNVGVVVACELEAALLPQVIYAEMTFDASDLAGFLQRWADLVAAAPRELTCFLNVDAARPGQPPIAQAQVVWAGDDTETAVPELEKVLQLAPVLGQQAQIAPYSALVPPGDGRHAGQQQIKIRNGFIEHMTPSDAEALAALLTGDPFVRLELRSMGGAINDVPADATAYSHRSAEVFVAAWAMPADPARLDAAWGNLAPHLSGAYSTYTSDTRPEAAANAYPPATYARLAQIKRTVDPHNVFQGLDA